MSDGCLRIYNDISPIENEPQATKGVERNKIIPESAPNVDGLFQNVTLPTTCKHIMTIFRPPSLH